MPQLKNVPKGQLLFMLLQCVFVVQFNFIPYTSLQHVMQNDGFLIRLLICYESFLEFLTLPEGRVLVLRLDVEERLFKAFQVRFIRDAQIVQ